jgi:hemerythrin-like domain-containing protein
MMYAAHDAFRRDVGALMFAPDRERWAQFNHQLTTHHTAEDIVLWPSLRRRLASVQLIDAMEDEHRQLGPLLARVTAGFRNGVPKTIRADITALSDLLHVHLRHEETKVLPLITEREWSLLDREMRRRIGLRGLTTYYTWLLHDVEGERRTRILATIPRPLRRTFARGNR